MSNGSEDEEQGRRRIDRLLAEALEQQVAEQRELAQVIGRVDEALVGLREGVQELTARVEGAVQPLAAFVLERLSELLDAPAPPGAPAQSDVDGLQRGLDAVRTEVQELTLRISEVADAASARIAADGQRAAEHVADTADAAATRLEDTAAALSAQVDGVLDGAAAAAREVAEEAVGAIRMVAEDTVAAARAVVEGVAEVRERRDG